MKANGKSIYGTTKSPYKKLPFNGRCTVKGNRLFLQVFEWPAGGLKLDGLLTPVKGVRSLANGARLKWAMEPAAESDAPRVLAITQPASLDPIATVVEVTLSGPPSVTDVGAAQRAGADGSFILKAADAEVQGQTAKYEQGDGRDDIGFWTSKDDCMSWVCNVAKPGRYRVEVTYACPEGNAGSQYTVGVDKGAQAGGTVKATGSWVKFESETIGSFDLPAGKQTIAVHVQSMPRGAVMNLRKVRLIPVR